MKINIRGRFCRFFPSVINDVVSHFRLILAGGSLRAYLNGEKVDDYDLFCFDMTQYEAIKEELVDYCGFRVTFECPEKKLLTLKHKNLKLQIIDATTHKTYEELIDSFDITACQLATDGWDLYIPNKEVLKDIRAKRINIHKLNFPAATLGRIMKYRDKGYSLSPQAKIKFIEMIKNNPFEISMSQVYID